MVAPVFDATAISSLVSFQANTLPISWPHTVGGGANNGAVVAVVNSNNNSGNFVPTGTPTADIGGKALTYLGSVKFNNNGALGFVALWSGLLVPAGSQTVTTSIAASGNTQTNAYGASFTYTGVGGFGSFQSAFGFGTAASLSVPSAVGRLVWGLIGNWWNDTNTSFSLTARQTQVSSFPFFIGGDTAGASSVTVSATEGNSREWAALGLDILPFAATKNRNISQAVQAALR